MDTNGKMSVVSEAYHTKEDCLEMTKVWKQKMLQATIENTIEEARYVIALARALIENEIT